MNDEPLEIRLARRRLQFEQNRRAANVKVLEQPADAMLLTHRRAAEAAIRDCDKQIRLILAHLDALLEARP